MGIRAKIMKITPDDAIKSYYSNPNVLWGFKSAEVWPAEKIFIDRYFEKGTSIFAWGAGRVAISLGILGYPGTGIDMLPAMLEAGNE